MLLNRFLWFKVFQVEVTSELTIGECTGVTIFSRCHIQYSLGKQTIASTLCINFKLCAFVENKAQKEQKILHQVVI